ncbi:MAG: hypothetical protein Q9209_004126 [Squamulea sp. 1 TL-2023]
MAEEITLFDLSSKLPNKAWSLNPWKTRLVLNYKSLPYKTHRLELPGVAPHLRSLSVPPNAKGTPYTIPTIYLPSSKFQPQCNYIMDSKAIVFALENEYPEPSLHLNAPQLAKVEELWAQAMKALRGVVSLRIPSTLLNDSSRTYFEETVDLEEAVGGDEAWEEARPVLEAIATLLKERGGPFVLGGTGKSHRIPS